LEALFNLLSSISEYLLLNDNLSEESMFSKEANTSKLALISLGNYLKEKDYKIIDCQVHNSHLESIGAVEISRDEFLKIMKNQIEKK
jgi:Leu/Phe-tRNA-protein transferase